MEGLKKRKNKVGVQKSYKNENNIFFFMIPFGFDYKRGKFIDNKVNKNKNIINVQKKT